MTISHKFLLTAATLLGLLLVATETEAAPKAKPVQEESSGSSVPQPGVDEEELRGRSDDNLRRQAEAEEKRRLEKEKRDAAIAAWEQEQAKQRERLEKEREEKEARQRARDDPNQCFYKPVMTDEDLERCRRASR